MSKINNKSINLGLKILTILAFILIFVPVNKVRAQDSLVGYGTNYGSGNSGYSNPPPYYPPTYYQPPVYYAAPAPATTPVVYSNTNNPNPVMTVKYTPTKTVATTTKPKTVATVQQPVDSYSNIAANAVYGTNSFMPSGIVQWILFALFVLIAVILIRRVFGAKEEYHAAPMKHE